MNAESKDEVLRWCGYGVVPVNAELSAAIAAHRRAPGFSTLRSVIMARTPTAEHSRAMFDYLDKLPETAWCHREDWPTYRERTLDAVRRSIAWSTICV